MPGWHAKTKELVEADKLTVLGITQEQHPDRTALFMQWQQMEWPVLLDSLNLLGCKGIPFTLLIDEHGIVRFQNPKSDELETFLQTAYEPPAAGKAVEAWPERDSAEGDVLWGGADAIDRAVTRFEKRVQEHPDDGKAHFRLGVAYRQRYDSAKRQEGDFSKAIGSWKAALAEDPSQYIWRRRIQQYGPRLDKPYSFYDWVHEARKAITARGETPIDLVAEPSGAEFAYPDKTAEEASFAEHPDPRGKVPQDERRLVGIEATAVPSTKDGSPAYRVHLKFRPNVLGKVHWTNDAGPLAFFPDESEAYEIKHFQKAGRPMDQLTSFEIRNIEFELRPSSNKSELPKQFKGWAYYYVCEDVNGQCLFLRQKVTLALKAE